MSKPMEMPFANQTDIGDQIAAMTVQGLGLNVSGLLLLLAVSNVLGPLGWTGTGVALMIKLIGDCQWIRAYTLWQAHPSSKT